MYLTDGYINVAIVCWKRTPENPDPYPEGYGLDHFGSQVDGLEAAEARARAAGATDQPPPNVDLAKMGGRIFSRRSHAGGREVRPLQRGLGHDRSRGAWLPRAAGVMLAHV